MDFPECKKLKEAFDQCAEIRKKQVWEHLLKGQLPPKEGDCEPIFSDYKDCYTEYMEKFVLAQKKGRTKEKGEEK